MFTKEDYCRSLNNMRVNKNLNQLLENILSNYKQVETFIVSDANDLTIETVLENNDMSKLFKTDNVFTHHLSFEERQLNFD